MSPAPVREGGFVRPMTGPLAGIKVLDLTRLLPGNLCTLLLADLGADVLKVEMPRHGDYTRNLGPRKKSDSYVHFLLNRNKRSMTLNLKHAKGKEIFLALVRESDVLVENFRPGVMERLGLGYDVLRRHNPRLVYCAISGFGQTGPYRQRAGHDLNYLGFAGALDLFGHEGGPPEVPGLPVADLGGALMACSGILAALIARGTSGSGQLVDVSLTDAVVYCLGLYAAWYFATGVSPKRGDHMLLGKYPCYAIYETLDGSYLTVACIEDHFWKNLCMALERVSYIDLQWSDEHREDIFNDFKCIFRSKSRREWMEYFSMWDVCVGPSYSLEEATKDPHLLHRQMFTKLVHPVEGEIQQLGIPIRLSATPGSLRLPPPLLGQDTAAVLRSLGYDKHEIERLREQGVV